MARKRKRKSKLKKVLFVLEILVLLAFIGGLYVYGQLTTRLETLEEESPEFEEEKIVINSEAPTMSGYTTYALFGIDHRDKNAELSGENSDTIIIASVNNDTKDIKMVSVYRDTLLNIGDGVYAKANAAYAYGGPEQAISMLNKNLDLDITDYITIDFNALVKAVDCVGGLDVPMSYAELVHMNNYCVETSEETDTEYTPIELPERPDNIEEIIGTYHLNGVQATSYCRIRYTANLDMGRTIRQRQTIQRIVQKAKTSGLTTIFNMMDEVFPYVQTSLTKNEILQMLPSMVSYALDDTTGFPMDYKFSNARGSIIVATDLVSNVEQLHKFLYGDDIEYTPTAEVQEYSDKILEIVGGEDNLETEQTVTEDDENTDNDNFIWNEGDDYLNNYTPSNSDYDYSEGGGDSYGGGSDNSDGDGDFYGGGDDYDYSSGGGDSYGGGDDYSSGGGDSYGGGDDYSSGGDSYGGGDDYSSGGDSYGGEDIPSVGGEEETSSYSAEPTGIADDQEE